MAEKEESCGSAAGESARPWQSYETVYTNAKAGMEGVDKEKVKRIVYEMSKGSKYFENEERKEASMKQKIENMRAQYANLTSSDLSHYQKIADKRMLELEATRDLSRIWLHVDMDAFYAAVETLSDPSLKGKPMAVGGMSMISTANYEARRFGVRAAMPGFIARKLCPELIFVPVDFKKYNYYSDLTRKVYRTYDPNFIASSLDEAYLDITEVCKERSLTSAEVAEELRGRVCEETGLTCSAGVGPNRLLAKVCSDINKPNGQFVLPNERMTVMTFISSLPIRKIGGIGKVTEHILRDVFGVNTCEEMLQKSSYLCALFSRSSSDFFLSVGLGLGGTATPQLRLRKSISNERTFSATDNVSLLHQKLVELAEMLSVDMQKEGLSGKTLTLKLKTASFEIRTRAMTLQKHISSSDDILTYATKLLKAELPISLRLIGLRISQFNEDKAGAPLDPTQKTLTNFIRSANSHRKDNDDGSSFDSSIGNHCVMNDLEPDFPFDNNEKWHHEQDPIYGDDEPGNNNCTLSNNSGPMEEEPCELLGKEASLLLETGTSSFSRQTDESDPNRSTNPRVNAVSSGQNENLVWVNDYKCSLCGIEMPPGFIEERQEHSDFHFAERLQREESSSNSRTLTPRPRPFQRNSDPSETRQSGRKKQKSGSKEAGHLPIDLFFARSKQNL